jgi:cytochrome c-type protein NapB
MNSGPTKTPQKRALVLGLVVVVSFVGFFVGINQFPASRELPHGDLDVDGKAPAARTNLELASQPWSSELAVWALRSGPAPDPVTPRDQQARLHALQARAERRAFEGAPPTVPHPVGDGSAHKCVACHDSGGYIGAVRVPPASHSFRTLCTQCHVPADAAMPPLDGGPQAGKVESDFDPLRDAPSPYRWTAGAPPQTPHTPFMRERCDSCHGVYGRPGLQTSHPERKVCEQCHASAAVTNQGPWP